MKKLYFLMIFVILSASAAIAQVGINADGSQPDPSAMLDVKSTAMGFLPPRVALVSLDVSLPVAPPVAVGLLVFNTATDGIAPNNVVPGNYCWSGTRWMPVSPPRGTNPGDMLFWNGAQYVSIPVGLPGQFLRLSAENIPTWTGTTFAAVTTVPAYSITSGSAISGGNITADGGATITARGVCWSTNPHPTTADSKTSDGAGTGMFTSNLTGLAPNSIYFIRAYATNATGTAYGNELSFTNACATYSPVSVSISVSQNPICAQTLATFSASPTNGGTSPTYQWKVNGMNTGDSVNFTYLPANGDAITCVLTSNAGCVSGNPATSNTLNMTVNPLPPAPAAGTHVPSLTQIVWKWHPVAGATGYKWSASNDYGTAVDLDLSLLLVENGLTCNTFYTRYLWAYNNCGNSTLTTLVQSTSATPVNAPAAAAQVPSPSQIVWNWNAVPGATGYKWSASDNYTTAIDLGTSLTKTETGLTCNTAYSRFIWAYGICGNSISTNLNQTTLNCAGLPTVTTTPVTNITQTTAASGGNVTANGGSAVTFRGVCWGTNPVPTLSNSYTTDGSDIGTFASNITGLTANTLYHLRAYAVNSNGIGYGNEITFSSLTTLTTTPATLITLTTAASGGNITDDGGAPVTARGVCWNISTGPTTANNKTLNGSGTGIFTSSLTGLTPNTLYYVRTYAINSLGTSYGNEITFTTLLNPVLPTVTTNPVLNILSTTATSGGNVLSDGGSAVIFRGLCWGANPNPTISDTHTTNGGGLGEFASSLTGLNPGTHYHVRAYAVNSVGTAYGNELTFTPFYVLGENVGGGVIFYVDGTGLNGLIASTSDQSTGASWGCDGAVMGTSTAIGTGQANTAAIVNGCSTAGIAARICDDLVLNGYSDWFMPSRDEVYQMYAERELIGNFSGGYYWTSSETGSLTAQSFAFSQGYGYDNHAKWAAFAVRAIRAFWSQAVLPVVTTAPVSDITQIGSVCGGTVTSEGGATVTARGVCWSTSHSPATSDNHTTDGSGISGFTSAISGLSPSTLYYVRSYATNSVGTSYGAEVSFTTSPPLIVTTTAVTFIATTSATSGGTALPAGGAAVTARGVCWSTGASPTTADSKTLDGTGTGTFSSNLTGLTPNTLYHVRAYAVNIVGTSYGADITFTTLSVPVLATVATIAPVSLTPYTASSGGNVQSDGGSLVVYRGICWSTTPNPTIASTHTTDGNGTGVFTSTLTGLTPYTIYHVRAYATNSVGTSYGNDQVYNNTFYVGASYGGGVIFYIDSTGQHGLISATSDLSSTGSWCDAPFPIGGTSTALGTGQANTTAIVNGCGGSGIAASMCNDLVKNGFDDWFLPSKDELNLMYLLKTEIGGFDSVPYWSSSEDFIDFSWCQYFNDGTQTTTMKHDMLNIRPVRAF